MSKPKIFISHITEEHLIANEIKQLLEDSFLGAFDVFLSSNENCLKLGEEWFDTIKTSIQTCKMMLVMCSPISINRPWITFEAGAGWMKGVPVIPICHSGLQISQLPSPLNIIQAMELNNEGIRTLLRRISGIMSMKEPHVDLTSFNTITGDLETKSRNSRLLRDIRFVDSILKRKILTLYYSIFESVTDVEEENKKWKEFKSLGCLNYNKIYNIFHYAHYDHSKQRKVFEELFATINSTAESIIFILSYQKIELPFELRDLFEDFLSSISSNTSWYDDLYFANSACKNEEFKRRLFEEIVNEPLPPVYRPSSNIINSFIEYYNTLHYYINWIIQYKNEIDRYL